MLYHYAKVTYRNLTRNKTFSFINLSGLIIGMAAALILSKYVGFILSYDQFHEHKERIVLIQHEETKNNVLTNKSDQTYWQTGIMAKELYPEVLKTSHYESNVETQVIAKGEKGKQVKFNERNIFTVDAAFTEMFSFNFIHGNPSKALLAPGSVVITQSIAKKYFKDDLALGKTLTTSLPWGEKTSWQITGVIEDIPVFSRFRFDFLTSSVGTLPEDKWEYATHTTYLLLDNQVNPTILAAKMTHDINNLDELKSGRKHINFTLLPLSEARFSETDLMLALVGLFILLITWINFINLTSAKSLKRCKETGIRQVLGSGKRGIISQFIFEGMILNFLGLVASIMIVWFLYPFISSFTDNHILPLFDDPTPINWMFLGLFMFGSLVSSAYPAYILSALHPIRSIKGQALGQLSGEGFRKSLVATQFCISIILITGIFVISDQMYFMKNQDLGIDLTQRLIVRTAKDQWGEKQTRFSSFKKEIANLSITNNVTSSTTVPGGGYGQEINFIIEGKKETFRSHLIGVATGYMNFYGAQIVAGEDFSKGRYWNNRKSILINKSTVRAMGFNEPEEVLNQKITNPKNGLAYRILGVVDDFHQNSLKENIRPMTFNFNPFRGHTSIKIDSSAYASFSELQQSLLLIEDIWNEIYPNQVFEYYFLDEQFNAQYLSDIRFRELFGLFAGISLFIACLGLFGLSLFIAQKKRKEVGIRKVFGASSVQILFFFIRQHLIQMMVSVMVGMPIAYWLMSSWLDNYSYRISINYWKLMIPSLLVVAISILTIGFHSLKMSLINPASTLRDE